MSRLNYTFTSESVSEGHPDKVCDRISDAVLDAFLAQEPTARVACETFATTNYVVVGGEVGLSDKPKLAEYLSRIEDIVRGCVRDIGYEQEMFHWNTLKVQNLLHPQSAHIAQGVDRILRRYALQHRGFTVGGDRWGASVRWGHGDRIRPRAFHRDGVGRRRFGPGNSGAWHSGDASVLCVRAGQRAGSGRYLPIFFGEIRVVDNSAALPRHGDQQADEQGFQEQTTRTAVLQPGHQTGPICIAQAPDKTIGLGFEDVSVHRPGIVWVVVIIGKFLAT